MTELFTKEEFIVKYEMPTLCCKYIIPINMIVKIFKSHSKKRIIIELITDDAALKNTLHRVKISTLKRCCVLRN